MRDGNVIASLLADVVIDFFGEASIYSIGAAFYSKIQYQ